MSVSSFVQVIHPSVFAGITLGNVKVWRARRFVAARAGAEAILRNMDLPLIDDTATAAAWSETGRRAATRSGLLAGDHQLPLRHIQSVRN